jgi:hypothetical protein
MDELVPTIHGLIDSLKTWMPGTRPGMTQVISDQAALLRSYGRSRHMAMPMPPPMHKVASPFLALRFCIS